jgi:hypothetical protein
MCHEMCHEIRYIIYISGLKYAYSAVANTGMGQMYDDIGNGFASLD